ncbi:MAG: phytoene desaturase family protein [Verrucomicrobiota bacterium]
MKSKPFAVIVGAGLGGVATAVCLRRQGFKVQVWDRNSHTGGKLQEWRHQGYRWDMGPSLLTMPDVLREWFASVNRKMEDYLTLVPLQNTCRYFWQDGKVIDEDAQFWKKEEIQSLLAYGEGVYRLSGKAYLEYPPQEFWRSLHWRNLKELKHLPKLTNFKTLSNLVDEKIKDPYLNQIFCRYATYNGSSPYLTPATFSIIPYVEAHFGGWYVKGGMRKIAEAIELIAREEGVEFFLSEQVLSYKEGEIQSASGKKERPDLIVSNSEVIRAANSWLKNEYSKKEIKKLNRPELSCSGFILLLSVRGENKSLKHHNILFTKDYRSEFTSIFQEKVLPRDPTIYLSITKREDDADAPYGCENWFLLVNSPAKTQFSEEEIENYSNRLIQLLRDRGALLPGQKIEYKKYLHAGEIAERDQSTGGALYGWASHTISSSLFRPPMKRSGKNIYFVGGSTHPGGGIPLVLLSSKMIYKNILKNFS